MSPATFRLVLLISCAHALVHVFELALPGVEQMIGSEFHVGRETTGTLGLAWRLPFGLGALAVGWLADRFGSKRLLIVYLCGCAATSWLASRAESLPVVFAAMFGMGCFASIYHPAGLALISRATTPANRGAALGWHGIVGSAGIAVAPLVAGTLFATSGLSWRGYYLLLTVPALIMAVLIGGLLREPDHHTEAGPSSDPSASAEDGPTLWKPFLLLVAVGAQSGFVYGAFLHFLPRYLDQSNLSPSGMPPESARNYLTAVVLLFAIVGQAIAGRLAAPGRLERQQALILLAGVPCLLWVGWAEDAWRLAASCVLALVHFMTQPIYNSLIAQYVPRRRRSVGYGFSNMVCFSIGALGPFYAGLLSDDRAVYGGLALVAGAAGGLALLLPAVAAGDPIGDEKAP